MSAAPEDALSLEELTRFGIAPEDELFHPHGSHRWWNESFFWDWFDERGERAGHCRFGILPNQQRVWIWLHLYDASEPGGARWIAIDEPRLPLAGLSGDRPTYSCHGLEVGFDPFDPLRTGRLRVAGFGRVLRGARAGAIVPASIDLEITGVSAPHARGARQDPGATSEGFSTNRFRQATSVRGDVSVADRAFRFEGHGDRDHAWGPRSWNMAWELLTLRAPDERIQAAVGRIPNVGRFAMGGVEGEQWSAVAEADFRITHFDDPERPFQANVAIKTERGDLVSGRLEPISATEIDVSHTDVPADRTCHQRALVRFIPDAGTRRRRERRLVVGWLESQRFR